MILNHEDIYSNGEEPPPRLLSNLEYLADIVIKTEPLSTGLAADVHGQVRLVFRITDVVFKPTINISFYRALVQVERVSLSHYQQQSRTAQVFLLPFRFLELAIFSIRSYCMLFDYLY